MEIVETLKIAPTKYIQVVRIGEKYFSYVVCKDTVTLLGELAKDDITEFAKDGENALAVSFVMRRIGSTAIAVRTRSILSVPFNSPLPLSSVIQ